PRLEFPSTEEGPTAHVLCNQRAPCPGRSVRVSSRAVCARAAAFVSDTRRRLFLESLLKGNTFQQANPRPRYQAPPAGRGPRCPARPYLEQLENRPLLSATVLVRDINLAPLSGDFSSPAYLNGFTFFRANDGVHGEELWKTDGTEAGTVLVKDIFEGSSGSSAQQLITFGDAVYFNANDGVHGTELWKSDGTADGTVLVKDINPGAAGSSPAQFKVLGNTLLFQAFDQFGNAGLWRTD